MLSSSSLDDRPLEHPIRPAQNGRSLCTAVCRLVDMLPKHWGGAVTGAKLSQHLREKQASHSRLLTLISQAGISSEVPASALNLMLEAGQLLATVGAVRQAESNAQEARQREEHTADLQPGSGTEAELLSQAIDLAGQSVQSKVSCSHYEAQFPALHP